MFNKEFVSVYRFEEDRDSIERIQEVTLDTTSRYGFKKENELLIGSKEWFEAIAKGQIASHMLQGIITGVFMAGHSDYPEFEMEADGKKSKWTKHGTADLYKVGKRVELTYVIQRNKNGLNAEKVIEIRIEK